jgi:hypothetical protein
MATCALLVRVAARDTAFESLASALEAIAPIFLVGVAGYRFAVRNPTWDNMHRHALAIGYVFIIAVTAAIEIAVSLLVEQVSEPMPSPAFEFYFAMTAAFAVILVVAYAVTRIILHIIKRTVRSQGTQISGGIQA